MFVNQVVKNFEINLIFLLKPFFYLTKKSIQEFEYLDNEKRQNKKHFLKAFIEVNKINFLEGEGPALSPWTRKFESWFLKTRNITI